MYLGAGLVWAMLRGFALSCLLNVLVTMRAYKRVMSWPATAS